MDSTLQAVLAASASFFLVTLIFAAVYIICKGAEKSSRQTQTQTQTRPRPRPRPRTTTTRNLSSITIDESASFDPFMERISMEELVTATGNFATRGIIGDGSFGLVYKAVLSSGVTVAVKKLSPDAFQGFREFRAEMETLGQLRHHNIVKILGYCVSDQDRVLIYEFIEKGSLDQWLYDTLSSSDVLRQESLSWEVRMKVIRGVANGLLYLHGLEKPVIHRDIKASNVLLDKDFEAHIADFGLARMIEAPRDHVSTQVAGTMGYMPPEYKAGLTVATVKVDVCSTHVSTRAAGTMGYMPPEYKAGLPATVKGDVYSFGVLMFEIVTQKRPNWPPLWVDGEEMEFVEWTKKMMELNREMEMVDGNVSRDGLREVEVKEYFRVANLCTTESPRERPVMGEVVNFLNQIST